VYYQSCYIKVKEFEWARWYASGIIVQQSKKEVRTEENTGVLYPPKCLAKTMVYIQSLILLGGSEVTALLSALSLAQL